jgi:putative PEP-CTERM system histidine kinase
MIGVISMWSHALAALLFGAMALWQLRHWQGDRRGFHLAVAFVITSAWAASAAMLGPQHIVAEMLSAARTFTFLSFMYAVLRGAEQDERTKAVTVVYFTVAAVIGLLITVTGIIPQFEHTPLIADNLRSTAHMLGLTVAAGCLVLVHNIYAQTAPDSRWGLRMPMIGLAGMWLYDLHLNTVGYLSMWPVDDLYAMRGAILAMLVPAFALRIRHRHDWRIRLSRAATFQSISAVAILAYLLLMMSATRLLEIIGGEWVRIGQLGLVFAITLAAIILLPSGKARAWLRVMLVKHLFQHRYDYREEWLRFTRTMGHGRGETRSIEDRVVKAIADIADAPAALLVLPDAQHRLTPSASWNWPRVEVRNHSLDARLVQFLETSGHIVDFAQIRSGVLAAGKNRVGIPEWIAVDDMAWCAVPLIHNERLIGIVLLAHPLVRRPLDWEDLDLFRTAGMQAASYLAEARSHHALADAQRFDEFNRRFAFIMHDIKNLVSQLSLVARNAERHAENPAFRADMIATLQSSVKKMNDMLARLSRDPAAEARPPRPLAVHQLLTAVAEVKKRAHPIRIGGDPWLAALADAARLEQAVAHLVQNAIDASPTGSPVEIDLSRNDGEIAIAIADKGDGMSAEFIRTRLFQPFASTKEGGFGIGAYEARALIAGMGGRLEVESRPGEGTHFTIFLPVAETPAASDERQYERKRA